MLANNHFEISKDHAWRWFQRGRGGLGRCAQDPATTSDCDIGRRLTIDMLPDFVLLELFNVCINQAGPIEKWHT